MPQLDSVLGLVQQDLQNRKYSQAMKRLVSVSNEMSHDLNYLNLLSHTQKMLGDLAGQIKTLAVIAAQTESCASQLDLMSALYVEGRLNEALDIGLRLQEREMSIVESRYMTRILTRIYLEFSDYEGVEEVLSAYRLLAPMDDVMVWGQGLVCLARDQKDEALTMFRRAVELNPKNEQAWVSLAMLHEEMGDRELALANIEKALDVNPLNSMALKLMMKWHHPHPSTSQEVIGRVDFYLLNNDFDEDMQLSYVQMLQENGNIERAVFEIDKMQLFNPDNARLQQLKTLTLEKHLQDTALS